MHFFRRILVTNSADWVAFRMYAWTPCFSKKIIGPFKNFVFVFIWYDPGMIEKALDVI